MDRWEENKLFSAARLLIDSLIRPGLQDMQGELSEAEDSCR